MVDHVEPTIHITRYQFDNPMWFRFLSIISLKWIANIFSVILLSYYVIPDSWQGYVRAIPFWFLSFVLAFACAEWALRRVIPGKREVILLIVLWFLCSLSYQLIYAFVSLGNVYVVTNSVDMYVQFLLELLAILLAARVLRQRSLTKIVGEGMVK